MIVIRINTYLPSDKILEISEDIRKQAETGVIVLPSFCEVLERNQADEDIALILGDGEPYLCSGCEFMRRCATSDIYLENQSQYTKLICPYHYITKGKKYIFCPNWPPKETER